MPLFFRRFVVVLIASVFIAGIFLSERLLGIAIPDYLLYTILPFFVGLFALSALMERRAGVLAFFLVGGAVFVFLALYDRGVSEKMYILSAVAAGAGLLVYLFQIRRPRRR